MVTVSVPVPPLSSDTLSLNVSVVGVDGAVEGRLDRCIVAQRYAALSYRSPRRTEHLLQR